MTKTLLLLAAAAATFHSISIAFAFVHSPSTITRAAHHLLRAVDEKSPDDQPPSFLASMRKEAMKKLFELSKEAGVTAGKATSEIKESEWRAIPEEFSKGVDEGEIEARSRLAKVMDDVGEDEDDGNEDDA